MNKSILQTFLTDAKSMLELGKNYLVLASVRPGLEYAVKSLCKTSHLDYDSVDTNLESMINSLKDTGIIPQDLAALMHKTRRCSNIGVHINLKEDGIEEVSKEQAVEAFESFRQFCGLLTETDYSSIAATAQDTTNVPMKYPDYYDTKRRYSGMWADCFSREALMVKPEYVSLYTKAMEEEDIEAMLNIAIGFLSKNTTWENDHAMYTEKGKDARKYIDYRYYYWAIRATYYTAKHYTEGKYIPKKYIANAIWDAYKYILETSPIELFGFYSCKYNSLRKFFYGSGTINPEDMNKLHYYPSSCAVNMFKPDKFDMVWIYQHLPEFTKELLPFLEELFTGEPIIVPVHLDANIDTLEKFRKTNENIQKNFRMDTTKAAAEEIHAYYREQKEKREKERQEQEAYWTAEKAKKEAEEAERQLKYEKRRELLERNSALKDEKDGYSHEGIISVAKHRQRIKDIDIEIAQNKLKIDELNSVLNRW